MHTSSIICGVINATPDSFYDGGRYNNLIEQAFNLIDQGADWLDIGGESTRPGADLVSIQEEMDRVLPIIEALQNTVPISIDTTKGTVATEAKKLGASILNDVRGFQDLEMQEASKVFETAIIMHSRGRPRTMQSQTEYDDVVLNVKDWLLEQTQYCHAQKIILDPGIGFAKELKHNIELMQNLTQFSELNYPIMLGTSRKSFIGQLLNHTHPDQRLAGSLGTIASAWYQGIRIFRVHDVRETKDLVNMLQIVSNQ